MNVHIIVAFTAAHHQKMMLLRVVKEVDNSGGIILIGLMGIIERVNVERITNKMKKEGSRTGLNNTVVVTAREMD